MGLFVESSVPNVVGLGRQNPEVGDHNSLGVVLGRE